MILWDVDTQVHFILPEGKLYVPGAEETAPAMARLVDAARAAGSASPPTCATTRRSAVAFTNVEAVLARL